MQPKSFKQLLERQEKGNLRNLSLNDGLIDFYSNDYLGIAKILQSEKHESHGSTGSRLISGNSEEAQRAEIFLSRFYKSDAALIFNSGYDANLGLFSSIATKADTIIYDQFIHASVRDGIRLSHAKAYSFRHNDLDDLKNKLQKATGDVFVAVESLYSMDGDLAPIAELVRLSKDIGFYLIVDEAHSGGVFGMEGRGLLDQLGLENEVFARLFTFGKAYGTHGAVILGSAQLKQYLINFARSFIYTTALPPSQYELIQKALEISRNEKLREELCKQIHYFRSLMPVELLFSDQLSPIQIIKYESISQLKKIAQDLNDNGIASKLIWSPTVPLGQERIRLCLHCFNTDREILQLAQYMQL